MRRVVIHEFGGPEVMRVEESPVPSCPAGSALVRLSACGVNFIDVYQRTGLYPNPLPYAMGLEGAGTVQQVGGDVSAVSPGDRVAWTGVSGSYSDLCLAPVEKLVKVPAGVSDRTAAAVMLQGMTAHYLTRSTYPLREGDFCLVYAAAGGVGLLLCQIARLLGARVIGVVSTDEKERLAREAGAQEVVRYDRQPIGEAVAKVTGGKGVQVVYDSVGRDTYEQSLGCLARRGMLVLFGQSSGPVPPIDPLVLSAKGSLFLTRPSLFHHISTREELDERARDLFDWISAGKLSVRIGAEYGFEQSADAHRALEGRRTTGKVLLIP